MSSSWWTLIRSRLPDSVGGFIFTRPERYTSKSTPTAACGSTIMASGVYGRSTSRLLYTSMLRIAGDDKPTEVVRSRLKKLNADHIRFVLGCLAENTSPVRNMKQYLLAALFNAPTTMNLYYQNKTNHDFARGSPKAG